MASKFGKGVVICLAKFSEHLRAGGAFGEDTLRAFCQWMSVTEEQQAKKQASARDHPYGDDADLCRKVYLASLGFRSQEETLSHLVEMWMNAASDHFYDLDRERAPACLIELADLALSMGHGFRSGVHADAKRHLWTMADVDRLRELWKQSCLALDAMLGVPDAEWGEW